MINNLTKQNELDKLWKSLSKEERDWITDLIRNPTKFPDKYKEVEDLFFYSPPPTPKEFLDPDNKWLSKDFIDGIYPFVKDSFLKILDRDANYNDIIMYGSLGQGKSTLTHLLIFYTLVYIHHMRSPKIYFNILTTPSIYLLSFTISKAVQLLLQPIYDLIDSSPRAIKVHNQAKVFQVQKEKGLDYFVWSTAANVGYLTVNSGVKLLTGASSLSYIGSSSIQLYISELAFFIEQDGKTEEEIFKIYADGVKRIKSRFGDSTYLAWSYLDTSANNADSQIENFILNELRYRDKTYFSMKSLWEALPFRAPKWQKTGETFKVITGKGTIPPKFLPSEEEMLKVPKDLIIDVPIDYYQDFKDDIVKSIKDIAGRPTSSENKFISGDLIERIFDNNLSNIEAAVTIDSMDNPEKLLWDQIKDIFFSQYDGVNYIIKRASKEPRFIGLDIATAKDGDDMGLSMGHWEWSVERASRIYVYDFTLNLTSGMHGISMDAWKFFILDLYNIGLNIAGIASDTKEVSGAEQFFKRYEIPFKKQSVDSNLEPYEQFKIMIQNDHIKAGRNIFLKNNLINLEKKQIKKVTQKGVARETLRIDHPIGNVNKNYDGDWSKSNAGYFAKDVSDSAVQSFYLARETNDQYQPTAIYEDENRKAEKRKTHIITEVVPIGLEKEEEDEFYKRLNAYQVMKPIF